MDIRDDQNHVLNITLTKCMGLYQMLDPGTTKIFRGKSVYHIVMAFITLYTVVIGVIWTLSGVYYCTNNLPLSIDYFWKGITSMYMFYPIWVVAHYSDDVWNCLSITCYGFTSHYLRDRHILDHWRERSILITNLLSVTYVTVMILYLVSSLALSKDMLQVKNRDGSVSNYRNSLFNLYLFVSDETYNAYYYTFFLFEMLCIISLLIVYSVFDIIIVSFTLAICCQMQMISTAFESVGHGSLGHHRSLIDCRDEEKTLTNKHDLIYDELKTIIMDHQAVMKKYDAFLTIFKRVLLIQIVVFSISFIILFFCFIMSFFNEGIFESSRIFTIKIFCGIPPNLIKLFALCYFIGNLHDQKDSIIFALYSSNWTEMDIKCKKLILLTMKMNNAHQKKLKFTRTIIVNLEFFFKTMRNCYSVLSVLMNYIKTMNE